MADYDFSKPAPDRSHRIPLDSGPGAGSLGFILAGLAIVLVVLYAVFGGAAVPVDQTPADIAPAADPAPVIPTE
ncbi:hypothetical protein [Pseudooctadecabacter sp.]|uniref:hypothetical protein n=1 Tax=Pseudooctadecabacter sp. TaxID=1966338 RepID=UPI0035C83866